jgi:hypothetical protein
VAALALGACVGHSPEPAGVDELKDAVLRMIVERFGARPLSWEDATQALALAAFEIKQAGLRSAS